MTERGILPKGCEVHCLRHHARFDIRTGAVLDRDNFPPDTRWLNAVRGEKALRTCKVLCDPATCA
jgi:3-phenylpropionate/trans-cinnamate dioxygenase ferredoxin subunit